MKNKLLNMLKHADGFISGEDMSKELGVSRACIWKHINALRKEGYLIEAVTNQGYRYVQSTNKLSTREISDSLSTKRIGRELEIYETVDSTNNQLKRLAANDASEGTTVIALQQTAGRGRLGRHWISEPGTGLYLSALFRPKLPPVRMPSFALAVAAATCQALKNVAGEGFAIKWPNDVLHSGKKIVGILVEMNAEMEGVNYLIAGIGINVKKNNQIPAEQITGMFPPGSVEELCQIEVDMNNLAAELLNQLELYYDKWVVDPEAILNDWKTNALFINEEVRIIASNQIYEGTFKDIDEEGNLLLNISDKTLKFSCGEVSLRIKE